MALETLKDVKEIGGYKVYGQSDIPISETAAWHDEYEKTHPIHIDHNNNAISFKLQSAPIKEVGVNGCQVDTLIHAARIIIEGLNKKFPSKWNDRAIQNLWNAIYSLEDRKQEREARGVEGTSQE